MPRHNYTMCYQRQGKPIRAGRHAAEGAAQAAGTWSRRSHIARCIRASADVCCVNGREQRSRIRRAEDLVSSQRPARDERRPGSPPALPAFGASVQRGPAGQAPGRPPSQASAAPAEPAAAAQRAGRGRAYNGGDASQLERMTCVRALRAPGSQHASSPSMAASRVPLPAKQWPGCAPYNTCTCTCAHAHMLSRASVCVCAP
jgi:hypothetical protein